jgi:hypothetical protein
MADKILDGAAMLGQLFGECPRVTYETADALPQCVIEPLDVSSFPGFLGDGLMLSSRNHAFVDFILIRKERRLLTVHRGKGCPQLFRTVVTAIPHVERDDLTRLLVHGDPDPWFVGPLLHDAPHLIGFHLKTSNDHITWGRNGLHMQMIRQRLKARD